MKAACLSENLSSENFESQVSVGNNCAVFFVAAGFPMGYAAAAPAYSPNMYPGANPTFQTGTCNGVSQQELTFVSG